MELQGTLVIAADKMTVWQALNTPEVLKECIPGCTELTGSFAGVVQLSDIVEGESYTISGEGKGGAAGFAKGGAQVALAEVAGGTELTYNVDAKVGGKLAQLGSRLIDSFAKRMADDFFKRFQDAVEGPDEDDDTETAEGEAPKKGWFKRLVG